MEIHLASPEELLAAHRNVHDVWSKGLSLEAHVARRQAAPHHNWARWYVGVVDGRVVSSLAAHPLELRLGGEVFPMIGIASVHTLADYRGRGYAPRLLDWVEHTEHAAGAAVSVLFSDINPDYYAGLGYTLCPSHEGWTTPPTASALDPEGYRLDWFKAASGLGRMVGLWSGCHGSRELSLERSTAYWQQLLDRRPEDEFFWLHDGAGVPLGFLRLHAEAQTLKISDWAVASGDRSLLARLLDRALALAAERRATRVGGWLPDWPEVRARFPITARPQEITMLKWLAPGRHWTEAQVAAADAFCEIDHI